MTSRAWLVDLIRSIGEKCAMCDHLEEIGTPEAEKLLLEALKARRGEMQLLVDSVEDPNTEYWCAFKHAVKSFTMATEAYEANPNPKTKGNMVVSADILAGATALFLGLEFKVCARCVNDILLNKERS